MAGKTVVILGGGVGGLMTANRLRTLLPARHRIVVVEKNSQHSLAASYLWVMSGDRDPAAITRRTASLLRHGVELVSSEVRGIDVTRGVVEVDSGSLSYDFLVAALGAEMAPDLVPGLAAAHTFYTLDGAVQLRDSLQQFSGGTIAVVVSSVPYKCPGAPHEGAMLIADTFRRRGMREKVGLHLFTPEPQPMPVAGPELGDAVRSMLGSSGVDFHPGHKLKEVLPEKGELVFEGKEPVGFDLLVSIPPHRGSTQARESGLANETGWIPVDPATLKTKHDNVYAIGDATTIAIPGRWKPDVPLNLPKAGVFAHCQADVVAHRIAAEINGSSASATFAGDGYCVLEAGGRMAGFAYGDFLATPQPKVHMRNLGRSWHVGKVLFEKWWLAPYGLRRDLLGFAVTMGARALGIPVRL